MKQRLYFETDLSSTPMADFYYFVHAELQISTITWRACLTEAFHSRNFQQMGQDQYSMPHQPNLGYVDGFHEVFTCKVKLTIWTCKESASMLLYTATVLIPNFLAVRITRHAISPLCYDSTAFVEHCLGNIPIRNQYLVKVGLPWCRWNF